ncbi:MAG: hypothetical protein ABIP63_04400, partial [Thermoanaerobaculia bacterium]
GFGEDYDLRIASLLRSHYRVEAQWRRAKFFLIVLRAGTAGGVGSTSRVLLPASAGRRWP